MQHNLFNLFDMTHPSHPYQYSILHLKKTENANLCYGYVKIVLVCSTPVQCTRSIALQKTTIQVFLIP